MLGAEKLNLSGSLTEICMISAMMLFQIRRMIRERIYEIHAVKYEA